MKKILALISAVVIMCTMAACGSFTCDSCMQEKSGKKHKTELLGREVTICDDCYNSMAQLGNMFK